VAGAAKGSGTETTVYETEVGAGGRGSEAGLISKGKGHHGGSREQENLDQTHSQSIKFVLFGISQSIVLTSRFPASLLSGVGMARPP
jgi:hypothetical protein